MLNSYLPKFARIKSIRLETADTKLFTFEFVEEPDRQTFSFNHGQFLMAGVLSFGEAAFDICSSTVKPETFELAIRKVGALTEKFHSLQVGDIVTIRGPFGNGLPLKNFKDKDLLLIGGGCGFVTVRSFVLDYLQNKLNAGRLNVFYGCLNEDTILFQKEFSNWRKKIHLDIALEKPKRSWPGQRGVVTNLFNSQQDFTNTVALVVGPPVMYKFVIEELRARGVLSDDIYLSLERRMHCGVGVCQHCAIGPYYVCKDGPVFSWEQLKNVKGAV